MTSRDRSVTRALGDNADDQARAWLGRIHAGDVDTAARAEFEAWLKAADAHRAAFERAEALWALIGQSDRIETWEQEVADREAGTARTECPRSGILSTRRIAIASAAAAGIALVVSIFTFRNLPETASDPVRYASAIAQTTTVSLADGSVLTLAGASEAAVTLTAARRHIELLRGSAYFEIESDPDRTMTVAAADTEIHVIGTAFGVRYGPNDVRVAVTEGHVGILDVSAPQSGREPVALSAGQRLVADLDGAVLSRDAADIDAELAWIEGRFIFDGTQLSDVVNDINRYRAKPIELRGSGIGEMRITTSFRTSQIDQFLAGLPAAYALDITEQADRTIISAR